MQSLERKRLHRREAERAAGVERRLAGYSRTSQVAHSSIPVGEEDWPIVEIPERVKVAQEQVETALEAAEQAAEDALKAVTTADGKNSIYAGMTEPAEDPESPFAQGDIWYVTDSSGRMTMVRIWNGTEWVGYQFVADSILVPGSVGPTLIEDGSVTTQKIAAEAIVAGKIASTAFEGGTFTGGTFTGSVFRTAASGQRLQFDSTGLRAFNGSGNVTASLTSAGGYISMTGTLRTGTGSDLSYLFGGELRLGEQGSGTHTRLMHKHGLEVYDENVPGSSPPYAGRLTANPRLVGVRAGGPDDYKSSAELIARTGESPALALVQNDPVYGTAPSTRFRIEHSTGGWHVGATGTGMRYGFRIDPDGGDIGVTGRVAFEHAVAFHNDVSETPLPGSSPFTVTTAALTVRAGWVMLSINVSGSIGSGTTDIWSGVPSAYRPNTNRHGAAWLSGGVSGTAFARSNGTVAVSHTSSTRTSAQCTIVYPLS